MNAIPLNPRAPGAPRRPARLARARGGFSLVELLVVVAILALLVGILTPSLYRAKALARSATCRSQLHQIGLAMQQYVTVHNHYPGALWSSGAWYAVWPGRLLRYAGRNRDLFSCPSADEKARWVKKEGAPPGGSEILGYDPDEIPVETGDNAGDHFSYGYNDWGTRKNQVDPYLGLGAVINAGDSRTRELSAVKVIQPPEMIQVADSSSDRVWDVLIEPEGDQDAQGISPGRPHNEGTNALFGDAHSTWMPYTDVTDTTDPDVRRRWNNDHKPY